MPALSKHFTIRWERVLDTSSRYVLSSMHAIRESMVWLIPCLMLSSFALLLASMGELLLGNRPPWVEVLYQTNQVVADFFPYLMTATIAYVLAMQWRLPRPPMALLAIVYLVMASAMTHSGTTLITFHIILAIITPLYITPLMAKLMAINALKMTSSDSAGSIVRESLNMVIPAIVVAFVVMAFNSLFLTVVSDISLDKLMLMDYANDPYVFGLTFASLNSLLWFFGIHGYYALLPMVDMLQEASNLSYSTMMAGGIAPYPMNLSFMGSFVFIGGSGSTLSLVLALLLFAKQRTLRLIAMASVPIALINVNEILLFGLPIIYNPRLLLPFVLTPLVNVLLGLGAVQMGWVTAPSVSVPFNSPILFNAWVATDGDWNAVLLQLFNVLVGCAIYFPAVRRMNQIYSASEIKISSLNTTYMRRQEEAQVLKDDPILMAQQKERELETVEQQLLGISSKEFCLEYQPQVEPISGRVTGCEALIRAMDESGQMQYPGAFLPWLEKAGLMKEMDLWVFRRAARDIERWNRLGVMVPVSINITPETLMDEACMETIASLIEPLSGQIDIEITEASLLADEQSLMMAFNQLHQLGVKIHIDDFGTGYSSLSYLNRFDIDTIKIDRSFVLALDNPKGRKVFASLQSVAHALDLAVIVEGVETRQQLDAIKANGVLSIQGWYYAKSLPAERFIDFINASPVKSSQNKPS